MQCGDRREKEIDQHIDSRIFAAVMRLGRADRVGSPGRGGAPPPHEIHSFHERDKQCSMR